MKRVLCKGLNLIPVGTPLPYLLKFHLQILLLDLEDVSEVVGVGGSLAPELRPHFALHHFPHLFHLDTHGV